MEDKLYKSLAIFFKYISSLTNLTTDLVRDHCETYAAMWHAGGKVCVLFINILIYYINSSLTNYQREAPGHVCEIEFRLFP